MQTTPKPHQTEALRAAAAELATADRATIVMPCGTGKTLVGAMIASELAVQSLVMFFPSLALIKQTLQAWKFENPLGALDYLCVCSDQTVDEDEARVSVGDLGGDERVTTDPARVRRFMHDRRTPKVIFSTYQSASMIEVDEPFDLAIMDEAHRTAGARGNAFAAPLSDSNIPIRKRVFMTATPRHVASDDEDTGGFSMLNEKVYGKIAYAMSIAEAIERGIICDYKIVVSVTTDADIAEIAEKHNAGRAEAATIAAAAAIRSAMDLHSVGKAITFHGTVQAANNFATDPIVASVVGAQMIGHVNGKQPSSRRDGVMSAFRDATTGVVTNARCLTEGVDVPSVDMVAFMNRKDSVIDIVQACGRAMRLSDGKRYGHVLLPLHVNLKSAETIENAVMRSGFREVWRVINSMREQDMIVAGSNGRTTSWKSLQKANQAATERIEVIGISSGPMTEEIRKTVLAVAARRLQNRSWEDSFALLVEAREKYDTWKFTEADPDLAFLDVWVETQKKARRNNHLREELEARLLAIGFPFNERQDDKWEAGLRDYLAQKNAGVISPKSSWINHQRARFKAGLLTPERIERLKAAGFEFDGLKARAMGRAGGSPQAESEPVSLPPPVNAGRRRGGAKDRKRIDELLAFLRDNFIVYEPRKTESEYAAMSDAVNTLLDFYSSRKLTDADVQAAMDAGVHIEEMWCVDPHLRGQGEGTPESYVNEISLRLIEGRNMPLRLRYSVGIHRYMLFAVWDRLVKNRNLSPIEVAMREAIIAKAGFIHKTNEDVVAERLARAKDLAVKMSTPPPPVPVERIAALAALL